MNRVYTINANYIYSTICCAKERGIKEIFMGDRQSPCSTAYMELALCRALVNLT